MIKFIALILNSFMNVILRIFSPYVDLFFKEQIQIEKHEIKKIAKFQTFTQNYDTVLKKDNFKLNNSKQEQDLINLLEEQIHKQYFTNSKKLSNKMLFQIIKLRAKNIKTQVKNSNHRDIYDIAEELSEISYNMFDFHSLIFNSKLLVTLADQQIDRETDLYNTVKCLSDEAELFFSRIIHNYDEVIPFILEKEESTKNQKELYSNINFTKISLLDNWNYLGASLKLEFKNHGK